MNFDRSKCIGGSDIASVMGRSRWKTPMSIWAEKTGKIQQDLSNFEAMEIGTELEPYVANKFMKKTGIKLRVDNRTFSHKQYPYMTGHIDRWVVGEDSLFEAKTCSAWKEKEWQGQDIPEEYVLQVNWYLGLVGKTTGHIAVLIGGQKFVCKQIQFDEHLFQEQVETARVFWEEFVLKDVAPMAMAGDNELLAQLYPESKPDQTIQFEGKDAEELNEWIADRNFKSTQIKELQEEMKEAEARIKQKLGDAEAGETELYSFSWKTQQRKEYTVKASSFRVLNTKKKG